MKKALLTIMLLLALLTVALAGCNESMSNNKMARDVESWQLTPAGVYVPQYER